MSSLRVFVLIVAACATLGCGGSAPHHSEGPITTQWTEADDAALGITFTSGDEAEVVEARGD